jgi:hypothetical protein
MGRYQEKLQQYLGSTLEELNSLMLQGVKGELKMSSTDKQALHDAYKKLLHISMEKKIEEIKQEKESKNESTNTNIESSEQEKSEEGSGQNSESIEQSAEQEERSESN